MSELSGQYVLVFRREPNGPEDPLQESTVVYYMREGLACFDLYEAKRWYYKEDAELVKNNDKYLLCFEVEKID